jgi:hypothetical protein
MDVRNAVHCLYERDPRHLVELSLVRVCDDVRWHLRPRSSSPAIVFALDWRDLKVCFVARRHAARHKQQAR